MTTDELDLDDYDYDDDDDAERDLHNYTRGYRDGTVEGLRNAFEVLREGLTYPADPVLRAQARKVITWIAQGRCPHCGFDG